MVLASKPKAPEPENGTAATELKESEIQDLIGRGGSAAPDAAQSPAPVEKEAVGPVVRNIRFYDRRLWNDMEAAVKKSPVKVSSNAFMLQAIHEKLERIRQEQAGQQSAAAANG